MLTRRNLLASAAAAAACAASSQAGAQTTYASQPVHILVGYPAGGGVDIIARLLQDPMKAALGQPIIVENRAGASAMLATAAVAKSPRDGYTLLACASGEVAINHFLFRRRWPTIRPRSLRRLRSSALFRVWSWSRARRR